MRSDSVRQSVLTSDSIFRPKYFHEVHGFIFVVDAADEARFDNARTELNALLDNDELRDAAFLVFANKQDMPQAVAPERVIDAFALRNERRHAWFVQGCCGTSGDGLLDGLDWITRQVKANRARRR